MKSEELFARAKQLLPGGVSSPVRAIQPYPFYTERASGSRLSTVDGISLIDCCMAYGPLILGHAHPYLRDTLVRQLEKGWLYGTPTPAELELAARLVRDHPGMEMVRFVSTGAEATMSAIRLARGFTEKKDIVKIEGGFHGAHDAVLVKAGSGATTLGVPDSAGVIPELVAHTLQAPYNDTSALEDLLASHDDVAAFILEPVMGNVGPILPDHGYLQAVRRITTDHDVLLIFDEVITGYRLGIGGAQVQYGVQPDLSTFGKIIGGGLPIGAFAGKREIMGMVAPSGPVYQAGTFNGNPLSLAAGIATLDWLHQHADIYGRMEEGTRTIEEIIGDRQGGSFVRMASLFQYFFRPIAPRNYQEAKECDRSAFTHFWKRMLEAGIFLPPSQFETCFLSAVHTEQEIITIGEAFQACLSG